MVDVEKVIIAWEIFRNSNPYQICDGKEFRAIKEPEYCMGQMIEDTITLLKEQDETITELQNAYGYLQKQFFEVQDKLLKEQEAVEQKTGHWVEQQINSYTRSTTCSVCGGSAPFVFVSADRYGRNGCGKDELTKYCPNCGAKMEFEGR